MIKSIAELTEKELAGKKVLLRVDFNVPVENEKISETYRIKANKETIDFLTERGAVVGLVSHITAIDTFEPILSQIKEVLGIELNFINDCVGESVEADLGNAKSGGVFLLENVRKHEEEKKNDANFAESLAKPFDLYVNNAFSESHRNYASLVAVTEFLPSYAGFLLLKEIEKLGEAINTPKSGKTLVLGGAKIETKFPVIKNFFDKTEHILIGGAVANVFLKAKGLNIEKSVCEDIFCAEAEKLLGIDSHIIIPSDYIMEDGMIFDIGPKTVEEFKRIISGSQMIIWNGPLGKVEDERFSAGSKEISKAIADSGAFSIVGGGDTIAFLEKMKMIDKFNYVSAGGGAMLEFLAGEKLPGLLALGVDILG